jgi:cyclopropane fatty-acyl-phospholipid synthase-like methyltransferase
MADETPFLSGTHQLTRSMAYDPDWVVEHSMGPNALWLAELLSQVMTLTDEMRVLDLGCGRALSSIFLSKEFAVPVWAADLWTPPSTNWQTIYAAGLQSRVFPLYVDACALPFADEYFDAVVSIDAYHYFGIDEAYLGYISRFIRPGGQLAVIGPGLREELDDFALQDAMPGWIKDIISFHSVEWWRQHWEKTGLVNVLVADWVPNSWQLWTYWCKYCYERTSRSNLLEQLAMLRSDQGKNLGFVRLVAVKR